MKLHSHDSLQVRRATVVSGDLGAGVGSYHTHYVIFIIYLLRTPPAGGGVALHVRFTRRLNDGNIS